MDASSPPRYRRFSRPGPAPQSADLPAYTRRNTLAQPIARREPVEHLYPLSDSKGRPWATLSLRSSAKSGKSVPTFFEKEHINGFFQLTAEKGDSIQSVTVTVTGRIITGSSVDETYVFLNQSLPLWSKTESRISGAATKLLGTCVWPFSIPLPKAVSLKDSGNDTLYRLPETFLERHTRASVSYEISVLVSRGKLRADSQIKTRFGYIPATRPDPPSLLRQLAYREGSILPGPEVDPAGWKTSSTAVVRGTIFKSRQAAVHCMLSLANPLSYTRGTVIPCRMTLESTDVQALDMFSCPSAPVVTLRRCVRFQDPSTSSKREVDWVESYEDVSRAVLWPAADGNNASYSRSLEGEIKLPKDLTSTSSIGRFTVSYTVVVSSFETVGFTPSSSQPILAEAVTIATTHARDSPRPVAYAPPAYAPLPVPRHHNDFYAAPATARMGR
ncbi:hypothetical protein DFH08DRAFT_682227 [Mycena albidolilacea]|uniref:Arrestin-like N-terminal domain-containing protein n=1 Tax=Mycena albidolilacea TaxID=1033008 RepID=A0AAD7F217_9AGAR|nr:hypothetical protein DFH08DRAFT_682227 [Mycena albidolilacea]